MLLIPLPTFCCISTHLLKKKKKSAWKLVTEPTSECMYKIIFSNTQVTNITASTQLQTLSHTQYAVLCYSLTNI